MTLVALLILENATKRKKKTPVPVLFDAIRIYREMNKSAPPTDTEENVCET